MMTSILFELRMIFSKRINLFHSQKLRNQAQMLELKFVGDFSAFVVSSVHTLQYQSISESTLLLRLLEFEAFFNKLTLMKYLRFPNICQYALTADTNGSGKQIFILI